MKPTPFNSAYLVLNHGPPSPTPPGPHPVLLLQRLLDMAAARQLSPDTLLQVMSCSVASMRQTLVQQQGLANLKRPAPAFDFMRNRQLSMQDVVGVWVPGCLGVWAGGYRTVCEVMDEGRAAGWSTNCSCMTGCLRRMCWRTVTLQQSQPCSRLHAWPRPAAALPLPAGRRDCGLHNTGQRAKVLPVVSTACYHAATACHMFASAAHNF